MKKNMIVLFVIISLFLVANVYAKQTQNNGKPFQEIWDAINELRVSTGNFDIDTFFDTFTTKEDHEADILVLQNQINVLEQRIEECCPTPVEEDLDGDGYNSSVDCNDNNASIYPDAEEICDGVDNNCDGYIDEGNICQECKQDVVIVFDESGSISAEDFSTMKEFGVGVVDYLDILPEKDNVGIVVFGTSSRSIININNNYISVINAINGMTQYGGFTCIGCGINKASDQFEVHGLREGAERIMIVLTDGENNRPEGAYAQYLSDSIIRAENLGATLFAIGVGPSVIENEIESIATDISGVQTAFFVPDFDSLSGILDQLSLGCTG